MTTLDAFDYELPSEAIAQSPREPRDSARLMVSLDPAASPEHRTVRDLPEYLRAGDVVVVNETKVLPARLRLRKPTGGAVEVFLLEQHEDGVWNALVKPSKRVAPGARFELDHLVSVEVLEHHEGGQRRVRFVDPDSNVLGAEETIQAIVRHGSTPLPPYITAPLADPGRYQTVFARLPGSVAAPTAGLHLTPDVLAAINGVGAQVHRVELRVGLDTFRPITSVRVEGHQMHSEYYQVSEETFRACAGARSAGGRVIAIGTTSVRALESAGASGELSGRTRLFIHDRYRFALVDMLLTNFHMPRSSLLVLLDAFIGPRWRQLYETGLSAGYRFLSFGDAMLVARRDESRHGSRVEIREETEPGG